MKSKKRVSVIGHKLMVISTIADNLNLLVFTLILLGSRMCSDIASAKIRGL